MTNPTPTAPITTAPPAPVPTVTPHTKSGISAAEAATMAEWARQDVASGKISADQAAKIFDNLGTPPEQRLLDSRSDEEKMLDQQFPAAKESDYIIQYYTPGQEPPVMPKEVKEFDTNARLWMSTPACQRTWAIVWCTQLAKCSNTRKR